MNRNLGKDGLSMSQASSISNLCNQRSIEIENELNSYNNYSKTFNYEGKDYTEVVGKPIEASIVKGLLLERSKVSACQAYLMEHIKLKDALIKAEKNRVFVYDKVRPVLDNYKVYDIKADVDETWGFEQLSNSEYSEFLEAQAYSAHIGQYIHKNGILDKLRKELPNIKLLEYIELKKDTKTIVNVNVHHKADHLLNIHNDLAAQHRTYEQLVNYYKAKVKNLVTSKNADIAQENANGLASIRLENEEIKKHNDEKLRLYNNEYAEALQLFNKEQNLKIKEIAAYRIKIDSRFQDTIDKYLNKSDKTE